MLSNLVANLLVALLGNCAIWIVLKSVSSVWKWPKHWSLVQCTWAWEWNGGQSEAIIAAVTVAASASATSKRWANNNLNFKFFCCPVHSSYLSAYLPTYLPTYANSFFHAFHTRPNGQSQIWKSLLIKMCSNADSEVKLNCTDRFI